MNSGRSDFFVHFNEEEQLDMWVECDAIGERTHPIGRCRADYDYSPYIMMRLGFARADLPEWREIDRAARELIEEFMVPCEETPHDCPVEMYPVETYSEDSLEELYREFYNNQGEN